MRRTASTNVTSAAADYVRAILTRREVLQSLFHAMWGGVRESWARHLRLSDISQRPYSRSRKSRARQLQLEKEAGEATARDSAHAIALLVDHVIRQLGQDAGFSRIVDVGPVLEQGVTLASVFRALANQARHVHVWTDDQDGWDQDIIRKLGYTPTNREAAREVLCKHFQSSYLDLEEQLLLIADDASKPKGSTRP